MKVLVAADKFKGSLSAVQVCRAIAEGINEWDSSVEVKEVPMADGGEGTSHILTSLCGGKRISARVRDPLGRWIETDFGMSADGNDAFIEMASASGLTLLSETERNPAYTSTVGTGDLILAALDWGAKRIILGIGGSATNDAGTGMATALGFRFMDHEGKTLAPMGSNLHRIRSIDDSGADARIAQTRFIVLCDVANPLYGDEGASLVFAPQKGADPDTVAMLEKGMIHLALLTKSQFALDINFAGAGAAGGLGAGARLFLNASIVRGIDFMIDYTSLERSVKEADLIITGEGKADSQTLSGKVVCGISKICREYGKPLWLVTGINQLNTSDLEVLGITRVIGLVNSGVQVEESMKNTFSLVRTSVREELRKLI
jgi:glycerate kinase